MKQTASLAASRPLPRERSDAKVALPAACMAFFVIVLDTTVVNIALPAIGTSLNAGISELQWVLDAYLVVFAGCLLSAGSLSDRLGATRCFTLGLTGFTLASAACGLAPSATALIAARGVQGLAAAAMLPSSLALLRQTYPDRVALARAVAIWTAAGGVAIAAGPVVGGVVTGLIGWRAIFLINLPVGALGLVLLTRLAQSVPKPSPVDLAGQILVVLTVAALTFAAIQAGHHGLADPSAIAGLGTAVGAAAGLWHVERRVSSPLLPPAVLRNRVVLAAAGMGIAMNFAFYGLVFVLSLYLQHVLHEPVAVAGALFLPMTALTAGVNVLAGRITGRVGPRPPLVAGQALLALGLAALSLVGPETPTLLLIAAMVPVGIGGGLIVPPLTAEILEVVPAAQAGLASGIFNAGRQLGSALGVAVAGALIATDLVSGMHHALWLGTAAVLLSMVVGIRCIGTRAQRSTC